MRAPALPAPVAPVAQPPVPRAPLMYPPVDRSSSTPPEPIRTEQFRAPATQPPRDDWPVAPQAVVPPAPVTAVPAPARLPEPVTAVPVTAPVMAPVTAPVMAPAAAPVTAPVMAPVTAPAAAQVTAPVTAPAAAAPVTAIPVTAITSPAPVVAPTSIMPASPGYAVNPVAAWRSPVWPAQPQLPPHGHTGGYPIVQALPTGHDRASDAPPRSRPPVGVLLLGLLIGLLVFGSTGYLIGSTANGSTVDGAPAGGTGQEEANRSRLNPVFVPLADAWVPWLGGCRSSSEAGGPAPQPGERLRVKCSVDAAVDVYFIQFRSAADRQTVRAARATQNATSARIAAGAAPVAAQRAGTSGRTTGHYVEFAYQADGRTYGGIYWDDDNATTGAYIEKQWTEGDGGWQPLRDTWHRHT
jgi:hypothetical protein